AEGTVLHRVVRENLETFLREAGDRTDGGGLPRFVEREFREFLTCGALGRGFARVRCENCAFERLVPFSCKRRGFCPSCGGRRMAGQAADLVDHVLPHVPMRQWVLSLPRRLRYLVAYNHALCRAVLGVAVRVVLGFYRRRAEGSPALAGISSASIQGRIALGPRAGARAFQIGREPDAPWVTSRGPCQAHLEGLDLHANIANITVAADDRAGVERLCRYVL